MNEASAAAASAATDSRPLIEAAREMDVALTDGQATALLRLLDELVLWNRTYNLTSIRGPAQMLRAHLLDSLSVLPDLSGQQIADVGTGAGFPGLPLAVLHPERAFTLIDSVGKKIRFVAHAARALGLQNVTPLQARVETLKVHNAFDSVVTRAYAPLPQLLMSIQRLCKTTTRVLAMKGRYPHEELRDLPPGWRLVQARAVRIPGLEAERHILWLVPDAPAARLKVS